MGLIRCTCIYRTASPDQAAGSGDAITAVTRDPWCPAAELHLRVPPAADRRPADDRRVD